VSRKTTRAISLAAVLIGWSGLAAPRLPASWQVPIQAVLGGVLARSAGAPLGLRPPELWRGVRTGLAIAVAVSAAIGSATGLPRVRRAMSERELPRPTAAWLLIRIPIGTVSSEEAAFRGALGTVAAQAFGPRVGRMVQASAFGLSHVADAKGAGESVAGTVLVTGVAGWVFGWLRDRTGSIVAPMLAHLAINEAGAVAALVVRSQTSRLSDSSR
jgi:membrane protease YdiL (CAAX protease family)